MQEQDENPGIPLVNQEIISKAEVDEDVSSYGVVEHRHDYQLLTTREEEAGAGTAVAGENKEALPSASSGSKLYDRKDQKQLLLDCYHRCKSNSMHNRSRRKGEKDGASTIEGADNSASTSRELILVTGSSGMGKTALATSIRQEVLADGGFFLSGKFVQSLSSQQQQERQEQPQQQQQSQRQQQQQRKPFAPFVSALTEWVEQVNRSSVSHLQEHIRDAILENKDLAAAIHVLLEEAPSLESVVGLSSVLSTSTSASLPENAPTAGLTPTKVTTSSNAAKQHGLAQTQFAVVFREFLQIMCLQGHQLVLLLDDLQWADQSSLDLLESLFVTDDSLCAGLMMIGTCRPNEGSMPDPVSEMLGRIKERKSRIVEVQIQKLSIQALCSMISDISGMPVSECQPLAESAFHETKGNALFARQYIEALCRDLNENNGHCGDGDEDGDTGSLTSASERAMEATDERIVKWLVRQMRRLPDDTQYLLQVMSCLGGTFHLQILQRTSLLPFPTIQEVVTICRERNFIVYNDETKVGRFAHDAYQEAAYSLFVPKDRPVFHLLLGRNLLEQCQSKEEDFEEYLTTIVDLLLVGKEHLTDEAERVNLAQWCLQVGRKVALSSSFAGPWAIGYMEHGIQLLSSRHWTDQYDLILSLHNAAATLAYCQDNHSRVGELVEVVRDNARSFMDQIEAFMTAIYSLGASGDPMEAMEVGLYVLEELGFPFPHHLSSFGMKRDLYKTKRMLQKFSESDIMNLSVNDNAKALVAMTVIHMLHPIFAARRPEYTVIAGSRMVRLTLKYGLSPKSK